MIIVMDDVVNNITTLQEFAQQNNKNQTEKWYSLDEDHLFVEFCNRMIEIASHPFDLSSCVGYEFWTHNDTVPKDWHIDKDEQMQIKEGVTRFPLCSMVYYVEVNDLKGGKLHIEDDIITPRTNRLVIFSPGKYHCVEPFLGKRITYCFYESKPDKQQRQTQA